MTRYASTPPATMMLAMRGPMMYPTPSSGADISQPRTPAFRPTVLPPTTANSFCSATSLKSLNPTIAYW